MADRAASSKSTSLNSGDEQDPEIAARRDSAADDDASSSEDEGDDVEDPTQKSALVVLWGGIGTFFVETSVHGFKYIVEDAAALWEKLFWTITLCLSLTIAGVLFSDSILAWQESPMVVNLGETGLPVRTLDFPAVTVCNEKVADRWYFIEAALNVIDAKCKKDARPVVCDYLQKVFKIVWNRGAVDTLEQLFMTSGDLTASKELHDQLLQTLPIEKQQLLRQMELIAFHTDDAPVIIEEYSKVLGNSDNNYKALVDLIESSFSKIKDVSPVECYIYPRCWDSFKIFYRQILLTESPSHPIGPVGTFITHFAKSLGGSFRYDSDWLITKDILDTSEEAIFIHDFFKSIMIAMSNEAISLLDVPALATLSNPYVSPLDRETRWITQPVTEINSRNCRANDFSSYAGFWKAYADRGYVGQNECELGTENGCCNYWEISLASSLKAVMLIMKYSQLHGKTGDTYEEYSKDFVVDDLIMKSLGFTNDNASGTFSPDDYTNFRNMRKSLVTSCAFGSTDNLLDFQEKLTTGNPDPLPECKNFDPMLTNQGICYTFNAVSFRGMAKDNHYMNTFIDTYHPKESDEIEKVPGSGQQYGFQLVLNSNLNGRPNNEPGNRRATEFKVALSNIYGPFDVRTDPVFIKAGTSTRVRVTPGFTTAAAGIQEGLSIADRKCRFRDENEKMKIFADYTRAGCRFECMLENAYDVCKCTPWNYPSITSGNLEICDMFGATCFDEMMSQVFIGEQCDCPEDCEDVTYTKFETSRDLNAEDLCTDTSSWVYKYLKTRKRNVEGASYRSAINKVLNSPETDQTILDEEECRDMVKYDLAIVTMEISVSSYSEYVREEATSIADQLANLGGTLGLFSGMSVLSMIEIFFWLRRIVFDLVAHIQLKRARNNA